MYVLFYQI